MKHIYRPTVSPKLFVGNILGAFALGMSGKLDQAVTATIGHNISSCHALAIIGSKPDHSISQLCKTLRLEHSSVVRLVDRLEKENLVQRVRLQGGDRRKVCIRLTEKGEEQFDRILEARSEVLQDAMHNLTASEVIMLGEYLSKLMPAVVETGDDQRVVCRICERGVCPPGSCPARQAHNSIVCAEEIEVESHQLPDPSYI